jgi:hypothetical protein
MLGWLTLSITTEALRNPLRQNLCAEVFADKGQLSSNLSFKLDLAFSKRDEVPRFSLAECMSYAIVRYLSISTQM